MLFRRKLLAVLALLNTFSLQFSYVHSACNPVCQNGATCLLNATCQCPASNSGLICDLPAAPTEYPFQPDFSFVSGDAGNWNLHVANNGGVPPGTKVLRLVAGMSQTPAIISSRTTIIDESSFSSGPNLVIQGTVSLTNVAAFAVIFAGVGCLAPGKMGAQYQYGIDDTKFKGIAFIFNSSEGSAYASLSTSSAPALLRLPTGRLSSECIGNVAGELLGRFSFEIRFHDALVSLAIYPSNKDPIYCLESVSMTSVLDVSPLQKMLLVASACCGTSSTSIADLVDLRFYSPYLKVCPITQLRGNLALVGATGEGDFEAFERRTYVCPAKTLLSTQSRVLNVTCVPTNDYKFDTNIQVSCATARICEPPCEKGASCNNGKCVCYLPTQQLPNCRFESSYLPINVIAFLPLTLDTLYYQSTDKTRRFYDKSGSIYRPYAKIGPGLTFFRQNNQINTCSDPCAIVPAFSQNIELVTPAKKAVLVSLAYPRSASQNEVTSFLFYQSFSPMAHQFFTWKNNASYTSYFTVGVDDSSQVYVAYNASSFNGYNTTGHRIDGNKLSELVAVSYNRAKNSAEIWFPLASQTSASVTLPKFVPSGTVGEEFHIGHHPAVRGPAHTGTFNAWCFGIFSRKLISTDIDQYVDACNYERGSSKVPGYPKVVPVTIQGSESTQTFRYDVTGMLEFRGNFTLSSGTVLDSDGEWNEGLNDPTSQDFNLAVQFFLPSIQQLWIEAGYSLDLEITVIGFRQGSIISDYIVALRSLTTLSEDAIQAKADQVLQQLRTGAKKLGGVAASQVTTSRVTKCNLNTILLPKHGGTGSAIAGAGGTGQGASGSAAKQGGTTGATRLEIMALQLATVTSVFKLF